MLWDNSENVAEAIPFSNFREKIDIVLEEILKGRYVEIVDELSIIYSCKKRRTNSEMSRLQTYTSREYEA